MQARQYFDSETEAVELFGMIPMRNKEFSTRFPGVKGMKYDSFSKLVGHTENALSAPVLPITRVVRYKSAPSLHECNGRCMSGSCRGTCECRCGGKNHGRGNFFATAA